MGPGAQRFSLTYLVRLGFFHVFFPACSHTNRVNVWNSQNYAATIGLGNSSAVIFGAVHPRSLSFCDNLVMRVESKQVLSDGPCNLYASHSISILCIHVYDTCIYIIIHILYTNTYIYIYYIYHMYEPANFLKLGLEKSNHGSCPARLSDCPAPRHQFNRLALTPRSRYPKRLADLTNTSPGKFS